MLSWFIGKNKGFQPNTLNNLRLWLPADRINQADNTAVETWADQSGNGFDATQGTSAARPTYIKNALNGLPVVRFDGTDDFLRLSGNGLGLFRNIPGATVFVVVKYSNFLSNNLHFFVSKGELTGIPRFFMRSTSDPFYRTGGIRLESDSIQTLNSVQNATNNFTLQTARINYQNTLLQQFIDGTLDGEKTDFQTAGNTSDNNSAVIFLARQSNIYFTGDIGELIVYNRTLSDSETSQVHLYLSRKWGIILA